MTEIFQVKIGNAQLVGEQAGQGHPLIFLHAGVGDRRMWQHQMSEFCADHQVVAYDRRGFGETVTDNDTFSNVDDLQTVLDQLAISAATLIGCSQGGRIAIDFALAYPQRVHQLVLIAPAISGAPVPEILPDDIEALLVALDEAEEADNLKRVNEIEAHLWLDGPTSPEGRVSGALRALFLDMNGIALAMPELTQEVEPASAYDRLADLQPPTLVIWGSLDFPHIQEHCRYLVETIANSRGEEIPDAAHLVNMEQPERVNQLLHNFLG